ncbi:ACT domain-containing protein [Oscillochloris sp. ZM17-4]|uniref:ACT domain-containing protein n=1 Tax=Oscillochloris sp. ZM17-4 TaxID=2866714 RepID=UPI001C73A884|nr:ACT domain-containing protein [Oscillochloris sp. ZM17-4]MBX0327649.1 ACT domain-containing protein [Oscillochloris sp. ZM17-4]
MELLLLPEGYAVCRLPAAAEAPTWGAGAGLWSLTRSAEELSLVCAEDGLPADVGAAVLSRGWRAMRVAGTLDFSLVGVLASLAAPLAEAGVSIFAVSTYDTDYLLVRADDLEAAVSALQAAGHQLSPL